MSESAEKPEIPPAFPEPVRGVDYELVDGGHGFLIPRQLNTDRAALPTTLTESVAVERAELRQRRNQ